MNLEDEQLIHDNFEDVTPRKVVVESSPESISGIKSIPQSLSNIPSESAS